MLLHCMHKPFGSTLFTCAHDIVHLSSGYGLWCGWTGAVHRKRCWLRCYWCEHLLLSAGEVQVTNREGEIDRESCICSGEACGEQHLRPLILYSFVFTTICVYIKFSFTYMHRNKHVCPILSLILCHACSIYSISVIPAPRVWSQLQFS